MIHSNERINASYVQQRPEAFFFCPRKLKIIPCPLDHMEEKDDKAESF
jgi:hypothetical protein